MTDKDILVIDDEAAICESLRRYLGEFGYRVTTAASAEEAGELAAAGGFALAVVDIRLPGASGEVFIARAAALRPGMGFIIHTGSTGYEPPESLRRLGVAPEDVFQKPLADLDVLRRAIDRKLAAEGQR